MLRRAAPGPRKDVTVVARRPTQSWIPVRARGHCRNQLRRRPLLRRRSYGRPPCSPTVTAMAEKGLRLPIQGVEDPGTGMEKAGATTTERQVTPLNSVNLAVNQLAPQPAVGGKNKGEVAAVGPSPAVATAKTDIAKWRCSPLDKKLELPITTMIHPPPEKIAPDFSL